tara:strand:- start:883 stop:1992 length:1110 start_codon:yes stop_codon:yes gene_type:complete
MREKVKSMRPFFPDDQINNIINDIRVCLKQGSLRFGEKCGEFEKEFSNYIGTKFGVSVNSCTTALTIGLRHFDVKMKNVIVPSNTFISCPNSIKYAGGTPKFVDINPKTLNMDFENIVNNIDNKTAGVLLVHIGGLPFADTKALKDVCDDKGLFLIEDCSHAHGATIHGKKAGSLGHMGCFSFYPTKIMTTGTGGMITTNDESLKETSKCLRYFGGDKSLKNFENFGNDWFLSDINCIVGLHQLRQLEDNINNRNKIAKIYNQELSEMKDLQLIETPEGVRNSYYKYSTILNEKINREELTKKILERYNIELSRFYYPCHKEPIYKNYNDIKLKHTEDILPRVLCLPIFGDMSEEEAMYVCEVMKKELN